MKLIDYATAIYFRKSFCYRRDDWDGLLVVKAKTYLPIYRSKRGKWGVMPEPVYLLAEKCVLGLIDNGICKISYDRAFKTKNMDTAIISWAKYDAKPAAKFI